MQRSKMLLTSIIVACVGLLGFALYLQLVLDMLPCPLCVMQRYAFTFIALGCACALFFPRFESFAISVGVLSGVAGAGVAGYQLWSIAQPLGSCGADTISGPINSLFPAKLIPVLYRANGLCETPYDPILGLSIPTWALIWLIALSIASVYAIRRHAAPVQS
ncbi:disulfide bond formation protein B [Undibacterium fentianense]|uniref:Disulfide bond formation protein B n=1 Tax=Undibacterium fentianense TaxID=2828728 RepID=A0A941IHD4_9BURK|nr:disulfide bond formation protein B [Undibacterium fentianense]MBR7800865.1 disulfide bond formation protein B [Undibacterium fentianense]